MEKYEIWIRADLQDVIFYLYIGVYNLFSFLISLYRIRRIARNVRNAKTVLLRKNGLGK